MNVIHFASFSKRIKQINNKDYIFDNTRKKYVRCRPEEWVRQRILEYLVQQLGYPRCLITLEENIKYGSLHKRIDILIRDRYRATPLMLIECKAPHYKINQKHFDQIAMYNTALKAPFITLTNGLHQVCFKMNQSNNQYNLLTKLPFFNDLF